MIIFALLVVYSIMGAYIDKKRPLLGHETGVVILMGVGISYLVLFFLPESLNLLTFNQTVFFDACLPLIIFSKGFNMKRKKFFQNFTNIFKFGIIGTLILFLIMCGANILVFKWANFNFAEDDEIQTREIFFLSAIMCSSEFLIPIKSLKLD